MCDSRDSCRYTAPWPRMFVQEDWMQRHSSRTMRSLARDLGPTSQMDLWKFGKSQGSLGRHATATYWHCTFGGHLGWILLDVLLTPIAWLMHRALLSKVMDDLSVKSITREDLEVGVIPLYFSSAGLVGLQVFRVTNAGLSTRDARARCFAKHIATLLLGRRACPRPSPSNLANCS